jgi:protein-S-isoprenylcysteine O-methyltransferase Ste14
MPTYCNFQHLIPPLSQRLIPILIQEHPSDKLITRGIYGEIRNPQFLAGLLLLWARDLTCTGLVINIVLSLYLISGAFIEERRFLHKFGKDYVRYRSHVPRFIPRRLPSLRSLCGAQDR